MYFNPKQATSYKLYFVYIAQTQPTRSLYHNTRSIISLYSRYAIHVPDIKHAHTCMHNTYIIHLNFLSPLACIIYIYNYVPV